MRPPRACAPPFHLSSPLAHWPPFHSQVPVTGVQPFILSLQAHAQGTLLFCPLSSLSESPPYSPQPGCLRNGTDRTTWVCLEGQLTSLYPQGLAPAKC